MATTAVPAAITFFIASSLRVIFTVPWQRSRLSLLLASFCGYWGQVQAADGLIFGFLKAHDRRTPHNCLHFAECHLARQILHPEIGAITMRSADTCGSALRM